MGGTTAQGRGIWDVCVLGKDSELIRSGFPLEEEAVTRRRKPLQAPVELGGLPQALSPCFSSSPCPSEPPLYRA